VGVAGWDFVKELMRHDTRCVFDIDVLDKEEMPASYFPHIDGLTIAEGQELLSIVLADASGGIAGCSELQVVLGCSKPKEYLHGSVSD